VLLNLPTLISKKKARSGRPNVHFVKKLYVTHFASHQDLAPVERVFSRSGLLLRPHRARMSDQMLEHLVFLKCNIQL
jgi:hypothetical protein